MLLNGLTYQGKISLDNGLVIAPESSPSVKIDFGNVLRAQLTEEPANGDQFLPGVVLRNGARLTGAIPSLSESTLKFPKYNLSVPSQEIAWLIYQPFPSSLAAKLTSSATGALLANGDFYEGTIKAAEADTAKVLSPIFGLRSFAVKQKELLAIFLHEVKPAPAANFEVKLTDGNLFIAETLAADRSGLTLRAGAFGTVRIDAKDVSEIRAAARRYQSLTELKPSRLAVPTGQTGPAALEIDQSLSHQPISVWGASVNHGIDAGVGVAATWELPPGFSTFVARAGLPSGTDPVVQVTFAAYVDGRQAFRSQPFKANDGPQAIYANISGARTLSLRVESTGVTPAISGVWIDPLLIRK